MRIKRAYLPKRFFLNLASATSVPRTLRRSVSKVAVTPISGPAENINARKLASEMSDK